jgi:hypothetical protein
MSWNEHSEGERGLDGREMTPNTESMKSLPARIRQFGEAPFDSEQEAVDN